MRRHIISIIFCCISIMAGAQVSLPKKCMVSQPRLLLSKTIKESDLKTLSSNNWGQNSKSDKFWTVYSDRENNITYNGPSKSSGKYSSIGFNDKVRIAKIENDFALIYEEPDKDMTNLSISIRAKSLGWIPMSNLLLWDTCPTDIAGVYQKAIIVLNLKHISEGDKSYMGKLFKNPDNKSDFTKIHSTVDFYYVMKRLDNGLVLLSKEPKLSGGFTTKVLYGWVNHNTYVAWNHRMCLEPNWDNSVARNWNPKTDFINIYTDTQMTDLVSQVPLGKENNVKSRNNANKYRLNPSEFRFPLYQNDTQKKGVYKLSAFIQPGKTTGPTGPVGQSIEILERKLQEKSIINIIIVIDATKSMDAFFPPVAETIKNIYHYFDKKENKVQVGVVVYRDYPDGDKVTEYLSMRKPTDPSVDNFFKNIKVGSDSKDRTHTEALYKGLEVALDNVKMGYRPENSNYMMVIGDCGNDLNDKLCLSDDAIIKKCVQNNIQMSSFQVRNLNEQSFLLFRKQMGKIVRQNITKQYQAMSADIKVVELKDGYKYKATNLQKEDNFFMASSRNASLGKNMEIAKLSNIITEDYEQFSSCIDAIKEKIANLGDDLGPGSPIYPWLEKVFTKEELEILRRERSLMTVIGYADTHASDGSELMYWKPVVYLSSDEFAMVMEKLRVVKFEADKGNENRKPFIDALVEVALSMLGDLGKVNINEMSYEEIMDMVWGIEKQLDAKKGIPLIKILDLSQAEFDELVSKFLEKYNKLDRLRSQEHPFSVEHNGKIWYWLPVDDLPGVSTQERPNIYI